MTKTYPFSQDSNPGADQAPGVDATYSQLIHYGRQLVKEYQETDGRRERKKKQQLLSRIQYNIGRWKEKMYETTS
jgi:hypothetical protein